MQVEEIAQQIADEQAKFIDKTIFENVPKWKLDILRKFKYPFLAKLLQVNIEVEREELIGEFGQRLIVRLNGRMIGSERYKVGVENYE